MLLTLPSEAVTGEKAEVRVTGGLLWDGKAFATEISVLVPPADAEGQRVHALLFRAPRTPGPVQISATYSGWTTTRQLALAPALPDLVVLTGDRAVLAPGDAAPVALTATLSRTTGRPSLGTRVFFQTCCVSDAGVLSECAVEPPVNLPRARVLGSDAEAPLDVVTATAVARPTTPAASTDLAIIAWVDPEGAVPSSARCDDAQNGTLPGASDRLTLRYANEPAE